VCLQETKLEIVNEERCYTLWGNNYIEWKHVPAENGARGILTIWHKDTFACERVDINNGFLYVKGGWKKDNKLIVIVNVYSPCDVRLKTEQWDEITGLKQQEQCRTWCVLGDFNVVRNF